MESLNLCENWLLFLDLVNVSANPTTRFAARRIAIFSYCLDRHHVSAVEFCRLARFTLTSASVVLEGDDVQVIDQLARFIMASEKFSSSLPINSPAFFVVTNFKAHNSNLDTNLKNLPCNDESDIQTDVVAWSLIYSSLMKAFSHNCFIRCDTLFGSAQSWTKFTDEVQQTTAHPLSTDSFFYFSQPRARNFQSCQADVKPILIVSWARSKDSLHLSSTECLSGIAHIDEETLSIAVTQRCFGISQSDFDRINPLLGVRFNSIFSELNVTFEMTKHVVFIRSLGPLMLVYDLEKSIHLLLLDTYSIRIDDYFSNSSSLNPFGSVDLPIDHRFPERCSIFSSRLRSLEQKFGVYAQLTSQGQLSIYGIRKNVDNALKVLAKEVFGLGLCFDSTSHWPLRKSSPALTFDIKFESIRERVRDIANPYRDFHEIVVECQNPLLSRTRRMVNAAWILVCMFNCRLWGGFVRDWVLRGETSAPKAGIQRSHRVEMDPGGGNIFFASLTNMDQFSPRDMDVIVPPSGLDVDLLKSTFAQVGITLREITINQRRYMTYLIADEDSATGPFEIELTFSWAPPLWHFFSNDVSTLELRKFNSQTLYWRVPFHNVYGDLNEVIQRAVKREMCSVSYYPNDCSALKLIKRGWHLLEVKRDLEPIKPIMSILTDVTELETEKVKALLHPAWGLFSISNEIQITSIYHIQNSLFNEGLRAQQNELFQGSPNERMLIYIHESTDASSYYEEFIDHSGFDPLFLSTSLSFLTFYDKLDSSLLTNCNSVVIYVSKVDVGTEQCFANNEEYLFVLPFPGSGYDSIRINSANSSPSRWRIFRYGQAIPVYKLRLKLSLKDVQ